MANHSLAYDFERFETRVPKRKEQPAPRVRVVGKNSQKTKAARALMVKSMALVISIVAIASVVLYNQATLNEIGDEINRQTEQLNVLMSEKTRLTSEIEGKMSIKSIEETAASMGLSKIENYQVQCIDLSEGNRIEVPNEQSVTLWSKIGNWIGQIKEYLHL